jgi:hypothetical protein
MQTIIQTVDSSNFLLFIYSVSLLGLEVTSSRMLQ